MSRNGMASGEPMSDAKPACTIRVHDLDIEYRWYEPTTRCAPDDEPMVLLHHGFGCVQDWLDFPHRLAENCSRRVLAYSRPGCGASSALPGPWTAAHLRQEAVERLPALLEALGLGPCHLYGHSDGASISLILAAAQPALVRTCIAEAPHAFAEGMTVEAVRSTTARYRSDEQFRRRVTRHNPRVPDAFRDWSDMWLSRDFAAWSIVEDLRRISCPVLVLQGEQDRYGSRAHAELVVQNVPGPVGVEWFEGCGHSPHAEQEDDVLRRVAEFLHLHDEAGVSCRPATHLRR